MTTASDTRARRSGWRIGRADVRLARGSLVPLLLMGAALSLWIAAVWLASGVTLDEVARYVAYELVFIVLPGWLVYRALVAQPGGRLREIVFGWSLGYLLEVLAFLVTAASDLRGVFYLYPLLVGISAAAFVWKRTRASQDAPTERTAPPLGVIWIGTLFCMLLLVYVGVVGFAQNPLPRDTAAVTYHEDTSLRSRSRPRRSITGR